MNSERLDKLEKKIDELYSLVESIHHWTTKDKAVRIIGKPKDPRDVIHVL